MIKLIKYEIRKQAGILTVLTSAAAFFPVAALLGWILFRDDAIIGIPMVLAFFCMAVSPFFIGVESILLLNRELKTGQSRLVWMVPRSTLQILGARLLAAGLQAIYLFVLFAASLAVGFLFLLIIALLTWDAAVSLQTPEEMINSLLYLLSPSSGYWSMLIPIFVKGFLLWLQLITSGFLAVLLARTILENSRQGAGFSVLLFFAANFLINGCYRLVSGFSCFAAMPAVFWSVFDPVYYLGAGALFFLLSVILADRALSL